jgi:hypothetical protein
LSYQWRKDGQGLSGATGSSYMIASVSTTNAGNYDVVINGTCGSTNSTAAALVVNSALVITAEPVAVSVCAGTGAGFSVGASGTGLSYQWRKDGQGISGATGSSYTITSVGTTNAGNYDVVINGTCGSTNSTVAALVVEPGTTASPLASVTRNLGSAVTFTTVASGTGPFTYVWKKNGVIIQAKTGSTLTLTNLGYADGAVYRVEVTGGCNTAVQAATLMINNPPIVSIVSPTNGAVFIAPASFEVLADAYDMDGTVTNVEFFQAGTTKLGQTNVAPYYIVLTNVPTGSYTFTARATDNLGAQGSSGPVSVSMLPNPPLTIITALHFDPQTGLFEQMVRVTNPTGSTYNAVRVYVYNLTTSMRVYNASGSTNGVPYVESHVAIVPGASVDFVIEYYVSSSETPNPTLVAALVEPATGGGVTVVGNPQHIDRVVMLSNKTLLIEFGSVANRLYYVQFSGDLRTWQTIEPALTGTGGSIQWVDNGEPQTPTPPATTPFRFYRVVWVP